jgi:hypothetical protein
VTRMLPLTPRVIVSGIFLALAALSPARAQGLPPSQWGPVTGPTADVSASLGTVPVSLTALGSFASSCVIATSARALTAFAAMQKASTLQVQRYYDSGCTQPVGAAIPSTALALAQGSGCAASTYCGSVSSNDGLPFLYLKVTVTDTSNSTNAVTAVNLAQGAE